MVLYKYLPAQLAPDSVHVHVLCRSLVEVTREQAVFEFHDEEGLLIGFYSPPFVVSCNNGASAPELVFPKDVRNVLTLAVHSLQSHCVALKSNTLSHASTAHSYK